MKKVIVAPLYWGLGHATRCIPIINLLLENDFIPIIASDGHALDLLKKEFPELETLELPPYNIRYGKPLKWSLLKQLPHILKIVHQEQKIIQEYVSKNKEVIGIISDNRFGVYSKDIPSAYITHQLNVKMGILTFLTSKVHQKFIKNFNECWIPDVEGSLLSGELSMSKFNTVPIKYIGIFSRLCLQKTTRKIDVLIVLSGTEPNRTQLENKLLKKFKTYNGTVILVQGKMNKEQRSYLQGNIRVFNYLLTEELQEYMNASNLIICRSGYSSVLDLASLGKKAFFIPVEGQTEQEYLAKYLENKKIAPYATEKDFEINLLNKIDKYNGFEKVKEYVVDSNLLNLFKRE